MRIMKQVALAMLVFMLGCDRKDRADSKEADVSDYSVNWYESTGDNLYIVANGKDVPVTLDDSSSALAAQSWKALRYEILYPNSKGKIVFRGRLLDRRRFLLQSWWITVPFAKLVHVNGDDPLAPPVIRECHKLESSCFDFGESKPPSGFDPARFQKP